MKNNSISNISKSRREAAAKKIKLRKNKWALDISNDAKIEVSDDLIGLVQTAYAGTEQGSFVNNISNLLPSDWAVLDFDDDPDVDSTVFYRSPRPNENWTGFKIQGLGHDGSRKSKDKTLEKLVKLLEKPGWWIESSGALRTVLSKHNCNVVTDHELLKSLFPNTDLQMVDETTYIRSLSGQEKITETVFGNPKLKTSQMTPSKSNREKLQFTMTESPGNNSFTDITKSFRESGRGVFGSLGGATKERLKQNLDLRRVLPQGGLLTALFPFLNAYKAKKAASPTGKILNSINKDFSLFAKNSKKLKSIANNLSVMKVEVNKLAKTQNVTPALTLDRGDDSLVGETGTSPTKLETEKEGFNLFLLLAAVAAVGAAVTVGYDKLKQEFDETVTKALKPLTNFGSDLFEEFENMFDWTNVKFSEIQSLGDDVINFFKDNLSKLFSMDTLSKIKDMANRAISRFLGRETTSGTGTSMYDPEKERTAGEAEGQQYVRDRAASRMAAQNDPNRSPSRVTPKISGISPEAAFTIMSESGATNKEKIFEKGGQIVDNDPEPGVKSYGIFGLNSQGSIQNFVQDNPQFGLKVPGKKPSREFDEQWRTLAKSQPEELLNAQLAWHKKYVLDPITNQLKSLLPSGIPVDKKLIMFMSDRRNQYGKYLEGEAVAYAYTAKNSEEWIRKVTEFDLKTVDRAFKTYLDTKKQIDKQNNITRKEGYHETGLVNRIRNRAASSLSLNNNETVDAAKMTPSVSDVNSNKPQLSNQQSSRVIDNPVVQVAEVVDKKPGGQNVVVLNSGNNQSQQPFGDKSRAYREVLLTQALFNNLVNNSGFTG